MITDHQLALELGNYIIALKKQILALEGVFTEYRIETPYGKREIPFRSMAEKIEQEDGILQIAAAQQHSLLQAIAERRDASALIRALHDVFLE